MRQSASVQQVINRLSRSAGQRLCFAKFIHIHLTLSISIMCVTPWSDRVLLSLCWNFAPWNLGLLYVRQIFAYPQKLELFQDLAPIRWPSKANGRRAFSSDYALYPDVTGTIVVVNMKISLLGRGLACRLAQDPCVLLHAVLRQV